MYIISIAIFSEKKIGIKKLHNKIGSNKKALEEILLSDDKIHKEFFFENALCHHKLD